MKEIDTSVRLEKVYNLTIANTHNVGDDGVLVHNCKRARRNAHLAGQKHPVTDIPFYKEGYPDFSSISEKDVQINFTGNRSQDFREANKAAGFSKTPDGYTWHHQDSKTM
ncbi:MAG TPA: hypothetical protein EYP59_11635 [Thiotrichaceae bacterium]|nr:hypothetical protein [Thiotrichaceae bacterium]